MTKKLLGFVLVIAMLFSCVSVMASAETGAINELEPNNDYDVAQTIPSDCTVAGKIIAGDLFAEEPDIDIDVFKFTLPERSKITLTLTSSSITLIPVVSDLEANYLLTPDIDELALELPEEYVINDYLPKGTYYVVLSDIFGMEDCDYTFTLKREPAVESLKYVNGVWKYHVNNKFVKADTLVKFKGVWFYVEDGIWNKTTDKLVKYRDTWFYVNNGKWNSKTTSLVKYSGKWFYIENGKWDSFTDTLVKYKGKWFYVESGKWNKKATTIVEYSGKKFYVQKGKVRFDFSGKVKIDDQTYLIKYGKVV